MTLANMEYYLDRAKAELELAKRSTCPADAEAHCTLARRFLKQVHSEHESIDLSFD